MENLRLWFINEKIKKLDEKLAKLTKKVFIQMHLGNFKKAFAIHQSGFPTLVQLNYYKEQKKKIEVAQLNRMFVATKNGKVKSRV